MKNHKEEKGKASNLVKGKAPKSTHYIVSHFHIGVNEDSFNTGEMHGCLT
jgi:hypothetical protein